MNSFAALLRKDLLLEVRGGQSTVALGALSLLVLVVLVFAFNPGGGEQGAEAAAGALWVALVFSGMLGATRVLSAENENGCMRALLLSPMDRAALYAAKLTAAFIFMTVAEMDMLQAEGQIRKGNFAAAAALINKTRVPNGLPALTDLNNTSPVR